MKYFRLTIERSSDRKLLQAMIHSWHSARKINTFKTNGLQGKGRPLFKKQRDKWFTEHSLRFQPIWMMRKDFLTSHRDLLCRLECWQCINRWSKLRTIKLGFAKLSPKSKKWPMILLYTKQVHKAKSRYAMGISATQDRRGQFRLQTVQ